MKDKTIKILKEPVKQTCRKSLRIARLNAERTKISGALENVDNDISIKQEEMKTRNLCLQSNETRTSESGIKKEADTSNILSKFDCQTCETSFTTSDLYTAHMLKVHSLKPNESHFYCKRCNRHFPARTGYRQHLSRVHRSKINDIIEPNPDDPNYTVKLVKKSF